MFQKNKKVILLFFIVLIGWLFRFNNINWDSHFHLHPDERFLTMVSTAMKLPANLNEYFSQKISLLNPSNIGYKFFVYGNFPLVINKYLAVFLKIDNYNLLTILGRQLSAFFDLFIVILIFKTIFLFEKKYKLSSNIKYWSAFIYAISVLPIQLSHFFTVDSFLNFFMFGSFYFALRYFFVKENTNSLRYLLLSAIFFGIALACKITAVFILPLIIIFVFLKRPLFNWVKIGIVILFILTSYFTLRFANPYYFQNSNFLDPSPNKLFVENILSLKNMTVKNLDNWFPPMVQWLNKNSFQHSLINNALFGFGIVPTIFLIIGIFNFQLLIVLFWVMGFFVYQSLQVTPTLRYFLIVYPFFAMFSGIGINFVLSKIKKRNLFVLCNFIFVISLLIWPLMFSSIYFHKNSRVEASEWIYKHIPNNSYILSESWDDSLPLSVPNNYNKQFTGEQLPVFDPDTPEKWQKMNESLAKGDYYILSSNRGWGSIPTVPKKYPLMSKFYNDLLNNKNSNYKIIKEFTSYPSLRYLGIPLEIPNQWSDEGFTVYDHTKVLIFKNVEKL